MELLSVKILVLVLSGIVRVFFGVVPLVVTRLVTSWSKSGKQRMTRVLSFLMFFGGGVLMATCFLHMMPEVRDNFKQAQPELELPLSEIIFVAGFFLVYMIEDIVHSIIHRRRSQKEAKLERLGSLAISSFALSSAITNGDGDLEQQSTPNIMDSEKEGGLSAKESRFLSRSLPNHRRMSNEMIRCNANHQLDNMKNGGKNGVTNIAYISSERFNGNDFCDPDWVKDMIVEPGSRAKPSRYLKGATSNTKGQNLNSYSQGKDKQSNNMDMENMRNRTLSDGLGVPVSSPERKQSGSHMHSKRGSDHGHSHLPMDSDSVDESIGGEIRNLLIVIAISFHGIFEGMAIGLQSTPTDVWYLFLAVSLHECTILFCIGVELISSKTKLYRMLLYILVVSLVSPVGIAIGILITEKANQGVIHQALIVGCFQGLAAGTLLYVTFFEIFQEEGRKLHRKCYHILVAILGFVLMGSLEFMGGHSHGGDGGHEGHDHGHEHHNEEPPTGNNSMTKAEHHSDHSHSHNHHH